MERKTNILGQETRSVEFVNITCKRCGDEQKAQRGSECHTARICLMCANNQLRFKKSMQVFEVR